MCIKQSDWQARSKIRALLTHLLLPPDWHLLLHCTLVTAATSVRSLVVSSDSIQTAAVFYCMVSIVRLKAVCFKGLLFLKGL